ncbi:ion channel [Streptomyces incanus]|uniref:Ion channel n=1 Tax=Streptomyces incanus TaxID=887453 RepID=A0ABW0XNB4_9ACTN
MDRRRGNSASGRRWTVSCRRSSRRASGRIPPVTESWLRGRSASNSSSESLSRTDAPHFAMTVFSTVGFGNITPRAKRPGCSPRGG